MLTGIHLMRAGEIEANLARLNETFKLPYIPELIERKIAGAEKGVLERADLALYQREYTRLVVELEEAYANCPLPQRPTSGAALHDLLVRLRLSEKSQ